MSRQYQFTSESVSEGHPDKLADQISDAILDAHLAQDPHARVACEALVKNDTVVLAGEITSQAQVNHAEIARKVIQQVGYTSSELGMDGHNCEIVSLLSAQSPQIAQGVDRGSDETQGAGDQGLMFGYACNETPGLLPAPIYYAHSLVHKLAQLRHSGEVQWLRPDAKSQVTLRYRDGVPSAVDTVVISTQHAPEVSREEMERVVREQVIEAIIPAELRHDDMRVFINPTGMFEFGGPAADAGLTGRKIIVDTYGGMARHGGGAFSGKDPSKVDRSAAYAARHVAKNLVGAGLAERCEVQISYAIGVAEPTSIYVDTFGTGLLGDDQLEAIVRKLFDLRPGALVRELNLKQPIYQATAAYGHFGRTDLDLPWERLDRCEEIRAAALELAPELDLLEAVEV